MSEAAPIRVLIAEDVPAVRDALEALLRSERGLELAASVGDAPSAIEAATRECPDVALVDVRMPGGGAHATRAITHSSPKTKVIAFTAHHDRSCSRSSSSRFSASRGLSSVSKRWLGSE